MISKRRFPVKRKIDDTFGKMLFRIFCSKRKKSFPEKIEKIILFKLSTIGDSLLCLPAIKKLKEMSNAKIVLVHSGDNEIIFKNQEFIDERILLDVSKNNLFRVLKTILKLRKQNADVSVDLSHTGNLSAIFSRISGKYLIGFFNKEVPERRDFYNYEFPIENEHMVRNYFGILSKINSPILSEIKLIKPEEKKELPAEIKNLLDGRKNFVGIHPCHEIKEKSWNKKNFAKIIDYLISNSKIPVILGSEKEKKEVQNLLEYVEKKDKVINLSGKLNLKEVFSIMEFFDFFISNDGGIMHVAASFGLPTLGIFSAETPRKYAPFNEKSFAIDVTGISDEESLEITKEVIDIFLNKHL